MSQFSPAQPRPERTVYSVSRLNREVRMLIDQGLAVIWVEGELSNFSQPGSGHWYFSLKDRDAQVRCAMFRTRSVGLGFTPRAGQHVLARGRVTLYEPRGEFQLIVEHLEEAGIGALRREFERLKAKLAAEGLFAQERKRPLPRFPKRIGVVTSPTGAALRDVLHILQRRFPPAQVLIYPASVQGDAAAPSLVAALTLASARAECDVLILARGGGSLEDLWAFNDERVARAICASAIAVVAGVGHEIDFTIADLVADARAPTPSGAAELVAPDRDACLEALAKTQQRLSLAARRELRTCSQRLDSVAARLRLTHPGVRIQQQEQRLDDLEQRLTGALRGGMHRHRSRLSDIMERLTRQSPERHLRAYCVRHDALGVRLQTALTQRLASAGHRLNLAQRALHAVSPLATLDRGFAIITREADGALVTDARALRAGEEIRARLAHGGVRARVIERIDEEPPPE
jgi:exodeoxyribonuclease VII large subunit